MQKADLLIFGNKEGRSWEKNTNQRKNMCVGVCVCFLKRCPYSFLTFFSEFPEKASGPDGFHMWFLPGIDRFQGFAEFFILKKGI